jgi:hypothetical protein
MAALGVPGQYGQPAPPRDEIAEFEDLQLCGTYRSLLEIVWI